MKRSPLIAVLVLAALLGASQAAQISLPISQELFAKLTLSMTKLTEVLRYFGTRHEYMYKYSMWKRTELTKHYLLELSRELEQYNNVITGASNSVDGDKNIIIGNYNDIEGTNNWVFVSNFRGNINGDLLIADWRVEMDRSHLILYRPSKAISFIREGKNQNLRRKYNQGSRKLCEWGDWAKPTSKNYHHWSSYYGYDDFTYKCNRKESSHQTHYSHQSSNHKGSSYQNYYGYGGFGGFGGY